MSEDLNPQTIAPVTPVTRNVLEEWDITVDELSAAVRENGSLRGMMLGYVAEIKLRKELDRIPEVTRWQKDDDHNRKRKGDLRVSYKGKEFLIEAKSLQTNSIKHLPDGTFTGKSQVDGSDRRTVTFKDGSTLETTLLLFGEFDILAVNTFGFEQQWNFVYALNRDLPHSPAKKYTQTQRELLIASLVTVTWPPAPPFTSSLPEVIERLLRDR